MPEPQNGEDSSYMDRLAALTLLRENMFFEKPSTYALTDVAEDLPGALRPIGGIIKNVLPSHAIISEDPEERKKQIDRAIEKIKLSRGHGEGLGKEIMNNAGSMATAGLVGGTALSLLLHGLGGRWIKGNKWTRGADGKLVATSKFRLPFAPGKSLGNLFSTKGNRGAKARAVLLRKVKDDAIQGIGWSAATGAAVPLIARMSNVSDKTLEDARKIMEEQPYITSLPMSEMLSAVSGNKEPTALDRVKNIGMGAGLGVMQGVASGVLPGTMTAGLGILKNVATRRPLMHGINTRALMNKMKRDIKGSMMLAAPIGAISGALTKNMSELASSYPPQESPNIQPDERNYVAKTPIEYKI
jgi:hypothetical protein